MPTIWANPLLGKPSLGQTLSWASHILVKPSLGRSLAQRAGRHLGKLASKRPAGIVEPKALKIARRSDCRGHSFSNASRRGVFGSLRRLSDTGKHIRPQTFPNLFEV